MRAIAINADRLRSGHGRGNGKSGGSIPSIRTRLYANTENEKEEFLWIT